MEYIRGTSTWFTGDHRLSEAGRVFDSGSSCVPGRCHAANMDFCFSGCQGPGGRVRFSLYISPFDATCSSSGVTSLRQRTFAVTNVVAQVGFPCSSKTDGASHPSHKPRPSPLSPNFGWTTHAPPWPHNLPVNLLVQQPIAAFPVMSISLLSC
jgi:hypothetical protein